MTCPSLPLSLCWRAVFSALGAEFLLKSIFSKFLERHSQERMRPVGKQQKEHLDDEAFYTSVYVEFCRAAIQQHLELLCLMETQLTPMSLCFNCNSKTALAFPKRSVYHLHNLIQLGDTSFIHLFCELLQLIIGSTECTCVLISKTDLVLKSIPLVFPSCIKRNNFPTNHGKLHQ